MILGPPSLSAHHNQIQEDRIYGQVNAPVVTSMTLRKGIRKAVLRLVRLSRICLMTGYAPNPGPKKSFLKRSIDATPGGPFWPKWFNMVPPGKRP
jgi:hypothetical protein